jgi:hypothetical protein
MSWSSGTTPPLAAQKDMMARMLLASAICESVSPEFPMRLKGA